VWGAPLGSWVTAALRGVMETMELTSLEFAGHDSPDTPLQVLEEKAEAQFELQKQWWAQVVLHGNGLQTVVPYDEGTNMPHARPGVLPSAARDEGIYRDNHLGGGDVDDMRQQTPLILERCSAMTVRPSVSTCDDVRSVKVAK
jgi:hypothetical protein